MSKETYAISILVVSIVFLIPFYVMMYQVSEINKLLRLEVALLSKVDTPEVSTPPPKSEPQPEKLLPSVMLLIRGDEGVRRTPYLDTADNPTIGIGRNLKGNGISIAEYEKIRGTDDFRRVFAYAEVRNRRIHVLTLEDAKRLFPDPLTDEHIETLFQDDLAAIKKDAMSIFPEFSEISTSRQAVILDLLFNLGNSHFRQFEHFIASVKAHEWKRAASHLLSSKAARQDIRRYHRLALILETGHLPRPVR